MDKKVLISAALQRLMRAAFISPKHFTSTRKTWRAPARSVFWPTGQDITDWGLRSTAAHAGSKIPAGALLLSLHPMRKGCGGYHFFLLVISKTLETKQKWAPTCRSTVYLSPDFAPIWLIGASFPLSPPPLLSGFHPARRSTGCPYGAASLAGKGKKWRYL